MTAIVSLPVRAGNAISSCIASPGIAKSVIYNLRDNQREAAAIASEALEFIPCGQFVPT
jgi:transposase